MFAREFYQPHSQAPQLRWEINHVNEMPTPVYSDFNERSVANSADNESTIYNVAVTRTPGSGSCIDHLFVGDIYTRQ